MYSFLEYRTEYFHCLKNPLCSIHLCLWFILENSDYSSNASTKSGSYGSDMQKTDISVEHFVGFCQEWQCRLVSREKGNPWCSCSSVTWRFFGDASSCKGSVCVSVCVHIWLLRCVQKRSESWTVSSNLINHNSPMLGERKYMLSFYFLLFCIFKNITLYWKKIWTNYKAPLSQWPF